MWLPGFRVQLEKMASLEEGGFVARYFSKAYGDENLNVESIC